MNTKNTNIVIGIIIAIAFIAGAYFYPQLPSRIASHWDSAGQVNGYMNKFWGIFLLPIMMLGFFALYFIIPKVDPLKNNIQSFRKYYNILWIAIFIFFLYIFGITLAQNIGYRFNITFAMVPAIAALWFFLGTFFTKLKRNWFLGIRTPWTLSNDIVWNKTHKLGGRLFQIAAIIALAGMFFKDDILIVAIVVPAVAVAIITVIYSYIEYKKI